jgi:hypothetical protein
VSGVNDYRDSDDSGAAKMNDELLVLVLVISAMMASATLLVAWCLHRISGRKSTLLALLVGVLFFVILQQWAQADQIKAYAFADQQGYVLVTAKDVADAKDFGKQAGEAAGKHAKQHPSETLDIKKVRELCEREALMRYPENRRVAAWFALQAGIAFAAEYEKRTKNAN